jgi:3,4-dihydroxy 2-butanone 4-phosphate synthase / GTP cyclohydrolase II
LRDLVGIETDKRGWTLDSALAEVAGAACGVVVILRHNESPREVSDAVQGLKRGVKRAVVRPITGPVLRTFGVGAQILSELGVKRMRVMSAPRQLHGLSAFGLEIVGYVDGSQPAARARGGGGSGNG